VRIVAYLIGCNYCLSHNTLIILLSATLGIGTAMVYPTFLATISVATRPKQRAESLGTFRLRRDLAYVFGHCCLVLQRIFFGVSADFSSQALLLLFLR